jgi:hypothetical protein
MRVSGTARRVAQFVGEIRAQPPPERHVVHVLGADAGGGTLVEVDRHARAV